MITLEMARTLHLAGDYAAAEAAYIAIIASDKTALEARFLYGMLAIQTERISEGLDRLIEVVAVDPSHHKAHNALGVAYHRQGRLTDAIAAFRQAMAVEPAFTAAAHNLARALTAYGDQAGAEVVLRQIIDREPKNAAALSDLGAVFSDTKRKSEAETAFRRALDLAPSLPEPARNLAGLYKTDGRTAEARALAPVITDSLARFMLVTTTPAILQNAAEVPTIRAEYLAALDAAPQLVVPDPLAAFAALGHFYFAYYDCPLRQIHETTAAIYRRLCPSLLYEAPHAKARRPASAKLRVAFVSANFHSHTINRLFAGLVVGLADQFDVLAVAAPGPDDQATAALGLAIPFVRLPRDLSRARQIVAELVADVLVYLDIGMEPFTYFLAHARLAPVQLMTWGHPVSPGLDTIDGYLSAEYLDPPGAEADHTERLYRLPAPAYFFERPQVPKRDRAHFGLPEDVPLYVCPQTLFKLHPDFDQTIADILRADREGRLILLAGNVPAWRSTLEARFKRVMPDVTERILFLPALPRADFLALLGLASVMLDIPSFSGGNTTLEAMAAGLPVVTLPSGHLRGRMTAGLLRLAGLHHGITDDRSDYCRRAIEFAHDGSTYRAAINDQAGVLFQRKTAISDFSSLIEQIAVDGKSHVST